MLQPSRFRPALAATLLCSSLLGACVVVPAGRYYGNGEVIAVAPPPAQVEVVGVAPGPGYFWINGYWGWAGGRHVWTAGHWEGHRPGYAWVPYQWHREGSGWRAEHGRWERR